MDVYMDMSKKRLRGAGKRIEKARGNGEFERLGILGMWC